MTTRVGQPQKSRLKGSVAMGSAKSESLDDSSFDSQGRKFVDLKEREQDKVMEKVMEDMKRYKVENEFMVLGGAD